MTYLNIPQAEKQLMAAGFSVERKGSAIVARKAGRKDKRLRWSDVDGVYSIPTADVQAACK